MKFLQYLNEASIEINQSMKNFTDNVLIELDKLVKKYVTFNFFRKECDKLIIYNGKINHKFGDFKITVALNIVDKSTKGAGLTPDKILVIDFNKEQYQDFYNDNPKAYKDLEKIILHELVHVVDPKLNKPELKDKNYKQAISRNEKFDELIEKYVKEKDKKKKSEIRNELNSLIEKYYKFPWELDAIISTEAFNKFNEIKKKSKNRKEVLNYLKNVTPDNEILKLYHDDQKIWKRFILSINKLIDKEYE